MRSRNRHGPSLHLCVGLVALVLALYHAERHYHDFADVSQRNPEARLFLNWYTF